MSNVTEMLEPSFFERKPTVVARELIGKFLVRQIGKKQFGVMITETESYGGPEDLASHARFGRTARTAPMFNNPGTIYVYFTYGMHWLINISCRAKDEPSAVLVRGLEGIHGPARLTKALSIDGTLSGLPLGKKGGLWIEDRGVMVNSKSIHTTPRIGIDYSGPIWSEKKWRFELKNPNRAKIKAPRTGGRGA